MEAYVKYILNNNNNLIIINYQRRKKDEDSPERLKPAQKVKKGPLLCSLQHQEKDHEQPFEQGSENQVRSSRRSRPQG
jgi:hypothetical protein